MPELRTFPQCTDAASISKPGHHWARVVFMRYASILYLNHEQEGASESVRPIHGTSSEPCLSGRTDAKLSRFRRRIC
jgi:hypothetical protein